MNVKLFPCKHCIEDGETTQSAVGFSFTLIFAVKVSEQLNVSVTVNVIDFKPVFEYETLLKLAKVELVTEAVASRDHDRDLIVVPDATVDAEE